MNWLKVAAVAIGALLVFLIAGSVVHLIMTLVGYVLIAALVAGGGYVAYKIVTSRHDREVRGRRDRREDRQVRESYRDDYRQPHTDYRDTSYAPPARPNVDDDLERLKRELGH